MAIKGVARVKPDGLANAILEELGIYAKEIVEGMNEAGDKITKAGAKSLKQTSPKRFGKYAKGWTVKKETLYGKPTTYTIHNKDRYQLAHLLEHGHAKRGGGRVEGTPHIRQVEEEVVDAYMKAVEEAIRGD